MEVTGSLTDYYLKCLFIVYFLFSENIQNRSNLANVGVNIPIRSITKDYKKNTMRRNIIVVTGCDLNCR